MEIEALIDHKKQRKIWVGFIAPRLLFFIQADEEKAFAENICERAKRAGLALGPIDKDVVQEALSYSANIGWAESVPRRDPRQPNRYRLTQDGAAELSKLYQCNQPGASVRIV